MYTVPKTISGEREDVVNQFHDPHFQENQSGEGSYDENEECDDQIMHTATMAEYFVSLENKQKIFWIVT